LSDSPPSSLSVLIPFGIVTLIWGSTWIVIAGQLGSVPASWSVAYRFLIAGTVMLAIALVRRESLRLDARGWAFAAVAGTAQFTLNYGLIYEAEKHVTSGLVAVVFALLLLPNALFGRIFLRHGIGPRLILGSIVAMIGIALLFVHEAQASTRGTAQVLTGVGFTLAAVFFASISNVMQATEASRRYPLATLLGASMLFGAAIDIARAWIVDGPPVIDWSLSYIAGLLYLGVIASSIAFTLYYRVIRDIGPARAAYSSVIIPVLAMLFSTVFEGYRWTWLAAAGGALTLVGLVIALSARRPAR